MKNRRPFFAGMFVFLVFSPLVANLSHAFRAEEPLLSSNNKTLTTQSMPTAFTLPVKPSVKQASVAEGLHKSGINVNWDSKVSSPFCVSGKDLEAASPAGPAQRITRLVTTSVPERAVAIMQNFASLYGIQDPANKIKPVGKETVDDLGFRHQRVSQTYQGLPVVGADLKVHFNKEGKAYQISGRTIPDIHLDPVPALTVEKALEIAVADFIAKGFEKPDIKNKPTLVIYGLSSPPLLAYELEVSDSPMRIFRYWIDAKNGQIIKALNRVCHGKKTISGYLLAGEGGSSKSFDGWYEEGYYLMFNEDKFHVVFRYDYPTDVLDVAYKPQSTWGTSVNDRQEVSVAFNLAKTMDYFKNIHNRTSVDGNGLFIYAIAIQNMGFVNAFWDTYSGIWFGDGDGIDANSLAVLDICGHEFTHGVTQYSADLIYEKESGALNESFSDIFGANVEFAYQSDNRGAYPNKSNGTADWFCGEDAWLSSRALRNMRDPSNTSTVGAGNEQPKKYQGDYWFDINDPWDEGGVHINSGVQNFFYYLLCEGGSGTNEGIPYNLTGIGITNARTVAYRALTFYCASYTDYSGVRAAWISAAKDLNSDWVPRVKAAWDAVDVGRITIDLPPSASPISYGQALSESSLSGGSASSNGYEISGSFVWTSPTNRPTAGASIQNVAFVPDGSYDNYHSTVVSSISLTIDPKSITGTFTASNKVYDATAAAAVGSRSVVGKVGSDNVSLIGGTATFDNASVGTGKTVTLTGATLTGSAAANYTLSSVSTTTANITPKTLTGTFTASNKVYDTTTVASVATRSVTGKVGSDDVNHTNGTATFNNASVGTGKTVTLTGATLTGSAAANYTLSSVSTTKANITKATPTISAVPLPSGITYGQTLASSTFSRGSASVSGKFSWTTSSLLPPAGTSSQSVTFTPNDAGNYNTITTNVSIMVAQKALTGGFTASSKTYDGTTMATVASRAVTGKVGNDDVNHTGGTAAFDSASAGNGKIVTLTGATLTGSAAGNYTLGTIPTTKANITKKTLTGSFTAANKEYNGNNAATPTSREVSGKIGTDDVNHTGGTATFASSAVGNGKTVALAGATLTGSAAANYTLGSVSPTTANITPKALTGSFVASSKVYDGSTAATVTSRSVSGKVGNDNVSLSGGNASFADATAGTGKIVTLTGASLTGSAAANYTLSSVSTTTANINKATPTIATKPTASPITFGQALSNSVLTPGQARLGNSNVDGTFTFTTPSTAPNAGTANHSVTFTPTDSANHNTVTTTIAVTINKATPSVASAPSASAITYGQALSSSELSGGSASYGGTPVPGTFAWVTPSTKPSAGSPTQSIRFTPNNQNNYGLLTSSITVTVNKATPVITWNNPSAITYGAALSSTQLNAKSNVSGSFAYDPASGAKLNAGTYTLKAVFTATDSANYLSPTTNTVSLIVNKATPTIYAKPTASPITFGQALSNSVLTPGQARLGNSNVDGTFSWVNPSFQPAKGTSQQNVRFTPSDINNLNNATSSVSVKVN